MILAAIKRGLYEGLDFNDDDLIILSKKVDSLGAFNRSRKAEAIILQKLAEKRDLAVDNIYEICKFNKIKFPMPDDYNYFRKFILACLTSFGGDLNLNWIDTANVTTISGLFSNCNSLTSLDASQWNTFNIINMSFMFNQCKNLTSIKLNGWDTSNVMNMTYMFCGCESLTSLDISQWDTSNAKYMGRMFYGCKSLTALNIRKWDTSNVIDMAYMFYECENLTSLDVSQWNTSKVVRMHNIFYKCNRKIKPDWAK